jgi:hypothetical protein
MKRIDFDDGKYRIAEIKALHQNRMIAEGINEIMDYLENDLKKEIKEMVVKEINNRFEILDL